MGYKEEVNQADEVAFYINLCIESRAKGCSGCRYRNETSCAVAMMKDAVKAMDAQQQRITNLEAELRDERHRHDRYMAETEELQKTKEKLEQAVQDITLLAVVGLEGCDICAYNVGDKANWDQCDFTCNNCLMDCRCKECKHGLEFKWRGTDDV